ncbi:MAG: NADH-quinone oxidoreductase subunit K [Trueperaceae bacterium]|nr:NADH-quinone oxidoreductase subunit K [Trueperaceae bacterium]
MEVVLALVVGVIIAGALYLVMQRNLLRFVFGLILLSGGVNLLLFTAGRPIRGAPPLVPYGLSEPAGAVANALPQALILTAIVIGFGLTAFALVLLLRAYERLGTLSTDELTARVAEPRPIADRGDGEVAP